jgi:hypothetical protein
MAADFDCLRGVIMTHRTPKPGFDDPKARQVLGRCYRLLCKWASEKDTADRNKVATTDRTAAQEDAETDILYKKDTTDE